MTTRRLFFVIAALTLTALAQPGKKLAEIVRQNNRDEVIYKLVVHRMDGDVILWSRTLPESKISPPPEWCALVGYDENEKGSIALLELNESKIGLLQFNPKGEVVAQFEGRDPGWLKQLRMGASISVEAPDKITISRSGSVASSAVFVDGRIAQNVAAPSQPAIQIINPSPKAPMLGETKESPANLAAIEGSKNNQFKSKEVEDGPSSPPQKGISWQIWLALCMPH
jgi:hypothetical protein